MLLLKRFSFSLEKLTHFLAMPKSCRVQSGQFVVFLISLFLFWLFSCLFEVPFLLLLIIIIIISLSDNKPPQVSMTLFSILTVLKNAVVWMFSIRPPISKYSSPFNNRLVTVPKAPFSIIR